jgi:iron complex transport system ATP-binding protein
VSYDGAPIATLAAWRLAAMRTVMAQAARIAFPFTVAEAARIGLDGIGRALPPSRRATIVAEALETADIAHLADRSMQRLSGGEQQRAHFARALCQLAAGRTIALRQALFLDEPVASLDLKHQFALMDAARRLARQGLAVLAVLHDLNLAAAYADRLVVMKDGAIAADGPPGHVLDRRLVADVFEVDALRAHPALGSLPFILPQALGEAPGLTA